jgi:hypothetical protein
MIVTCYYDIYNNGNFLKYLELFSTLGNSGISIILFTDPVFVSSFSFPNVTVIGVSLETFELYSIGIKYNGSLPSNRNQYKDTKEFLSLMNSKIEFIKRASETVNDDTFLWIDFGILKIVKNTDCFIKKLKLINEMTFTKIKMPGCWEFKSPYSHDYVNWRFCGGFFAIPRHHIDTFYSHSKNILTDLCILPQKKLTWETNVWYIIQYGMAKDIIDWYSADHNDSIILNLDI